MVDNHGRTSYGNVAHALDILLFFKHHEECTLAELSEFLKIRKSYALKLLEGLKEKNFIVQDTSRGVYRLGLSCLEIGTAYEERLDIRKVSHKSIVELANKTNELVHLGVLDSNVVVLLERIMGNDSSLRLQFHLSLTSPPYSTGLGKVLLAFSKPSIVEQYISTTTFTRYTPHTTVDPKAFRLELEQIRVQGYYLSYETFESGISCLAAPIFSKNNEIVAAVSICAPSIRIMSNTENLKSYLLETTNNISEQLGYNMNQNIIANNEK